MNVPTVRVDTMPDKWLTGNGERCSVCGGCGQIDCAMAYSTDSAQGQKVGSAQLTKILCNNCGGSGRIGYDEKTIVRNTLSVAR